MFADNDEGDEVVVVSRPLTHAYADGFNLRRGETKPVEGMFCKMEK